MKKRIILILAFILMFSVMAVSCTNKSEEAPEIIDKKSPIINPLPEAVNKNKATVRLYFGYLNKKLLVSETNTLDVPANENIEESIIKALISGPSATRVESVRLIHPKTEILQIHGDGADVILSITLSKEFLQPVSTLGDEEEGYEKTRRYLAVYSIVNSLIEQGKYSRVRILIDDNNTGTGRPLTNLEAGLDGAGATEPFGRNGEIELNNASNTMREILNAAQEKDWETLYGFLSYKNAYDQEKPSLEDFKNEVIYAKMAVSGAEVIDSISTPDGLTNIVMTSYSLKLGDDEAKSLANVPIRLTQENDGWKMTYNVFKTSFLT